MFTSNSGADSLYVSWGIRELTLSIMEPTGSVTPMSLIASDFTTSVLTTTSTVNWIYENDFRN